MSGVYADPLEYGNWCDRGCDLQPSCLSCPRERCIEEEPRGRQRMAMRERAGEMAEMRRRGMTTRQIALSWGVSQRTVQRELRRNGHGV